MSLVAAGLWECGKVVGFSIFPQLLRFPGLTFPVPGELHVHYISAGSGTVDGARIGGYERLAAAFAQADAPFFIRERFRETNVDSTLE